jgi:hypothetical protein
MGRVRERVRGKMTGGFGISIDHGTWTWRRCQTFLRTRVMVRVGIIAIPDAFLANLSHDGVSVVVILPGDMIALSCPRPPFTTALVPTSFGTEGVDNRRRVSLLHIIHRRGRLHLHLRDGRRGWFPIIRGSRDVRCAGKV